MHGGPGPENCAICNFICKDFSEAESHFKSQHRKQKFVKCLKCAKTFIETSELKHHEKTEHTVKTNLGKKKEVPCAKKGSKKGPRKKPFTRAELDECLKNRQTKRNYEKKSNDLAKSSSEQEQKEGKFTKAEIGIMSYARQKAKSVQKIYKCKICQREFR